MDPRRRLLFLSDCAEQFMMDGVHTETASLKELSSCLQVHVLGQPGVKVRRRERSV